MNRFRLYCVVYSAPETHLQIVHAYDCVLKRDVILKTYSNVSCMDTCRMYNEVMVHKTLCHRHICTILGCEINRSTNTISIILEKLESDVKKDIQLRAQSHTTYSELELFVFLYDISSALRYAKQKKIAHRDIKPANVLLTRERRYKLADFGAAAVKVEASVESTVIGTPVFFSPQLRKAYNIIMFTGQPELANYNAFKSDVYSLGVTVLYMATLNIPNLSQIDGLETRIESAISGLVYSEYLKYTLRRMFCLTEEVRADISEVFELAVSFLRCSNPQAIDDVLQEDDDFLSDVCPDSGDSCGICHEKLRDGMGDTRLPCCRLVRICSILCIFKVGSYTCPRCSRLGDISCFYPL